MHAGNSHIQLATGVSMGMAFGNLVESFTKSLITPVLGIFGSLPSFRDYYFTLSGSQFRYGELIDTIVAFVITTVVVQYGVIKPLKYLAEKEHELTMRDCPECVTPIKKKAIRCPNCCAKVDAILHEDRKPEIIAGTRGVQAFGSAIFILLQGLTSRLFNTTQSPTSGISNAEPGAESTLSHVVHELPLEEPDSGQMPTTDVSTLQEESVSGYSNLDHEVTSRPSKLEHKAESGKSEIARELTGIPNIADTSEPGKSDTGKQPAPDKITVGDVAKATLEYGIDNEGFEMETMERKGSM